MDREEFWATGEYFLYLVRRGADAARQAEPFPEKPEGVDWRNVFLLSEKHSLSAVTWRAIEREKERLDKALCEKWEHAYQICAHADVQQSFAWEEIKETFSEKGIRALPLKGLCLKALYPEPSLRLMGDLDILYDEKQFSPMCAALRELGYRYKEESAGAHHQVFVRPPMVNVEMHRALLPETSPFSEYYADAWQKAVPTKTPSIFALRPEDQYIFLLIHACKHFSGAGSGVRTILDFYLFLNACGKTLDRAYLEEEIFKADALAEKAGAPNAPLRNFEQTIYQEIDFWFKKEKIFLDERGLEILSDGVYGKPEKRWKRESEKKGRKKYLFQRLFPPFAAMKNRFPILNRIPVFLPFLYFWRLLYGALFRRKAIAREVRCVNGTEKKRAERRGKKRGEKRTIR